MGSTQNGNFNTLLPIITNSFPGAISAGLFTYTPITQYGAGPLSFSITGGALGLGLALNATTGVISGLALPGTLVGLALKVTDSQGRSSSIPIAATIS